MIKIDREARSKTLADIRQELSRARHMHPQNERTLAVLNHFVSQLNAELKASQGTVGEHITIRTSAICIAAMAIRIIEEGDDAYRYAPGGHSLGPLFTGKMK